MMKSEKLKKSIEKLKEKMLELQIQLEDLEKQKTQAETTPQIHLHTCLFHRITVERQGVDESRFQTLPKHLSVLEHHRFHLEWLSSV